MKVAMIPARGGSKRIPRKNIRLFNGKPIIAWSIEAALQSGCFDRVVVSTDDPEIAQISLHHGAEVPFTRPAEIANDFATTVDVIRHCIDWFTEQQQFPSHLCCIYATAPFVRASDLQQAWQLLVDEPQADYVFPVCSFPFPVQRGLLRGENGRITPLHPEFMNTRSQDLPEAFHDAGQFYWGKSSAFLANIPLYGNHAIGMLLPRHRVQDIDTNEDWLRAEVMLRVLTEMQS